MDNIKLMVLHYSKNVQCQLLRIINEVSSVELTYCGADFCEAKDAKYVVQSNAVLISQRQFSGELLNIINDIKVINPNILFIYAYEDEDIPLKHVILAGVTSFIDEVNIANDFIQYLNHLDFGDAYIAPTLITKVLGLISKARISDQKRGNFFLNKKRYDILALLAEGKSYAEIGLNTGNSLDVVRFHIKNIYRELNVNNKGSAIRIFLEDGVSFSNNTVIETRGKKKKTKV